MPKGIPTKLRELDRKLTGETFWGRFNRYVLNTTWDEDYRERKGEIEESNTPSKRVKKLVAEVVADSSLFKGLFPKSSG